MKPRKRTRLLPVRRSWRAAWWDARNAVRSGVQLDDYLRYRLAAYLASLPVAETQLPQEFSIQEGGLVLTKRIPARAASSVEDAKNRSDPKTNWLRSLMEVDGPVAIQDVQAAQADVGRFTAEAEVQSERVEKLAHEIEADIGSGKLTGPAAVEATPEQMGRPPVPHPRTIVGVYAFCLALLLAETWQLAIPYLRATGIDTGQMVKEFGEHPIAVALGAIFALGASLSLFVFAQVALERGIDVFLGEAEPPRRRIWLGATSAGAALLTGLTGWLLTGMRQEVARGAPDLGSAWIAGSARWTFFLLLLVVPLATACLLRLARQASQARELALEAALAWDRERYEALAERTRRLELLEWAQHALAQAEEARDAAQRTLRILNRRGIEAGYLLAEAAATEERELAQLSQSLAAAVELDRYEFIRQATQREATHLVPTPHRPAPVEPRVRRDPPAPVPANNLGLAS